MEEARSVLDMEDGRFQQTVQLLVEIRIISAKRGNAGGQSAESPTVSQVTCHSQVVLMDEDEEAVQGQQADGAPCWTGKQCVLVLIHQTD